MAQARKTKIICTIGPASESPEVMREMILSGMNVARMNFSHGTHPEHLKKAQTVKALREELKKPVALLLDTKGPEIRVKTFAQGSVELKEGALFTLTTREREGGPDGVAVTFAGLPTVATPGTRILLDDGLIELRSERVTDTDVECRVINGGPLSNRKSINLPGVRTHMPYMDERDEADIRFAHENDYDFIALSFVRCAKDVRLVKDFIARLGERRCELIAKIENAEGVQNVDEILAEADGIMVARGDLGVEIPFEDLPALQKAIIKKCYSAGKLVVTATQMLDSMARNPRPTRAEVTDVANAIYDGTGAIMLSGESAAGKYPLESVRTMVKIAEKTESAIHYIKRFSAYTADLENSITDAISHAACTTAHDLQAKLIVAATRSGNTARTISRFRPATRIVAVTPNPKAYYQLALWWGVTPVMGEFQEHLHDVYKSAAKKIIDEGLAEEGDRVVFTGSSSSSERITNTIQVHTAGEMAR